MGRGGKPKGIIVAQEGPLFFIAGLVCAPCPPDSSTPLSPGYVYTPHPFGFLRLLCPQTGLRDAVLDDFKLLLGSGSGDVTLSPDNVDRLSAACLVVDALGPKARAGRDAWLGGHGEGAGPRQACRDNRGLPACWSAAAG
jgi:hypothetical protein